MRSLDFESKGRRFKSFIAHLSPRDILDQYTHQSWGDFCRVVNSIKLKGQVKAL